MADIWKGSSPGFRCTCAKCGVDAEVYYTEEEPGYSECTPGGPAAIELVCPWCGSNWDDGKYTERNKFPSARPEGAW